MCNILTPSGQIIATRDYANATNADGSTNTFANNYYFYHYDIRGSVTTLLKPDATIEQGYSYDEYGNATVENSASLFHNEMSYTGAISDSTTGLTYMNARYYNPATGTFTSQDTYYGSAYSPWTQHLYSYTGANPINFTDPTGHSWNWGQIALGVGLVVLGIVAIATVAGAGAGVASLGVGVAMLLGTSASVGVAVASTIVIAASIGTIAYGGSEAYEGVTGDNPVKDAIGEDAYYTAGLVCSAAAGGYLAYEADLAATSKSSQSKPNFANEEKLNSHYQKHVIDQGEYGSISKQEYLNQAQKLVTSRPCDNILTKLNNGKSYFYNTFTNDFAVTQNNIIKTFFKPINGIDYFNRQ